MVKKIKKLGKVYRRGKEITLQDVESEVKIPVTVIMHDSRQGFLAENKATGDWTWYREPENKEYGWEGPYYKVMKK
jgi:hypothetical protein|tara:strand:+ start:361 stop:588 length:228 start_codon:yes stop_codon:yes gene_type:complete